MTPHAASVDLTLKELEREVKALEADLAKVSFESQALALNMVNK